MKKIVKPHKARKPSASTDVPSFARGKDQILKSPARLQRRKKNELGEFDDGKDNFKNIRDAYNYVNRMVDPMIFKRGKDQIQKDQPTINWITNWLNNRQQQLRNNYLDSSGIFSSKSYGGPHPINALIDAAQGNPKGYTTTKEILQDQLNNLNRSRAIVTDDAEKVFPGRDAVSMLQQIRWDIDKIAGKTYNNNLIFYNPENDETNVQQIDPSVRVHESTHTLEKVRGIKILPYRENTPQEEVIRKKYSKYFDNTGYSKQDAEYLSSPDEIYARMMQLRYDSKLSPKQKVDDNWIKANQKLIQKHNLNFKNGKLKDMLNEIAYNPISNDDVYYANTGKDDHRYYDYILTQSMLGNPTAKRMTGEDDRYIPAFGQGDRSNIVLGSYDNYATPSVMNIGGELMYTPNPWAVFPEWMVQNQSFRFNNPNDAIDFAENYKYSSPAFAEFFGVDNSVNYDKGKDSGIHIKKKNRGKFTAAAKRAGMGVQAYARKILNAPKGKYSSTLRKRANFARNFAH